MKTASKSYQKNPTNTNARKLEKAQHQLTGIYLKEQAEYVQNQIDKIRVVLHLIRASTSRPAVSLIMASALAPLRF